VLADLHPSGAGIEITSQCGRSLNFSLLNVEAGGGQTDLYFANGHPWPSASNSTGTRTAALDGLRGLGIEIHAPVVDSHNTTRSRGYGAVSAQLKAPPKDERRIISEPAASIDGV
jgi:hypothetical protein